MISFSSTLHGDDILLHVRNNVLFASNENINFERISIKSEKQQQ